MKILAYLYDADGSDREIELKENILNEVSDRQLLRINILERDKETVKRVVEALVLKTVKVRRGSIRVRACF
ncbi:MAG: hypothetical protein LH614_11040 [Pyrinomonadaceae bacterium]|nr:hypothetical protein [Pyrinomonadaceae bacterium]